MLCLLKVLRMSQWALHPSLTPTAYVCVSVWSCAGKWLCHQQRHLLPGGQAAVDAVLRYQPGLLHAPQGRGAPGEGSPCAGPNLAHTVRHKPQPRFTVTACMLNVFAADTPYVPGPCWSACGPWMRNCSTKSTACSSHQRAQTCKEDKANLVSCTAAPASRSPVAATKQGPPRRCQAKPECIGVARCWCRCGRQWRSRTRW